MGRNRKPQTLKRAQGNPGKRRLPPSAGPAAPASVAPASAASGARRAPAPPELKGAARKIWQRVVALIAPMQFIRAQDHPALARYCLHLHEFWKLTGEIARKGMVYQVKSRHGTYMRLNPRVIMRDRVEGHLVDLEDRFGLNPRARQQIIAQLAGLGTRHPGADLFGQVDPDETGDGDGSAPGAPPASGVPSPVGILDRATRSKLH